MSRGSLQRRLFLLVVIVTIPVFTVHEVIEIRSVIRAASEHTTADTRDVAAAAIPLLKSTLIVDDLATTEETLDNIMRQGHFLSLRLLDPDGTRVLAEAKPAQSHYAQHAPAWFANWLDLRFAAQQFSVAAGGTHYGTLVAEPSSQYLVANIWELIWMTAFVWLATLSATLVLLRHTLRRGLRPLEALAQAARRLGEGDLKSRAPVSDVPELAETAIAFNRMADNLASARNHLEERVWQATRDLENLITRIPVGVYKLRIRRDDTMRYDYVSPRWCELLELDARSLQGDSRALLSRLHPDEVDGFEREFALAQAGPSHFQWEGRLRKGMRTGWLRIEAMPTVLDNGDVLWEGIQYDISARRQAEESLRASEEKLRGLYELSPLGIALTDMQGRYIEFNEAFRAITGYPTDELRRLDYWTLTPRKYEADEQRQLESLRLTGHYGPYEKEYLRKGGNPVPLSLNGMLVQGPDGQPRIWSIVEDITEKKRGEASLRAALRELDNLIARIPVGVYKLRTTPNGDMRFDYVSRRWCQLLEITEEEARRDPMLAVARIHPEEVDEFLRTHAASLANSAPFQWEGRLREGMRVRWLHIESAPTRLDDGDTLWEGIQYDISATKEREAELDRIAHYDALTGIPNRILLADRLHQAIAQARRTGNTLAVCYLDLDGFKPINDKLGHKAGDLVLVEIAHRLLATVRGGDTVARIGGDEFVLLLSGMTLMDEYETTLNRILEVVNAPIEIENAQASVSASIGVSFYPRDDVDPDHLLRHADAAMYRAKQAGRNGFIFSDPGLEDAARLHREQLHRIEAGLADNEFELHYQPRVNMRLGSVVGYEALICWRHPEKGVLPAPEFLPLIEDNDLIATLGAWAIDQALGQLTLWRRQGLDLCVSVNVAARHLQQADFVERLRACLARYPEVPPERLEIEMAAAFSDLAGVTGLIDDCRRLGVAFVLDDFGSGHDSLTYLKNLPAQTIKIAPAFVLDMLVDANDLAIVEGVIELTEIFGRQVIADGVESVEHGLLLLDMDCELGQGPAIAPALPASRVEAWQRAWQADPAWLSQGSQRWPRDDRPLVIARHHHREWVDRVAAYLDGTRMTPPEPDSTRCRFGLWYGDAGQRRYGRLPDFAALAGVHEEIHRLGHELIRLADRGRHEDARARLPELHALRDELLTRLRRLMQVALASDAG